MSWMLSNLLIAIGVVFRYVVLPCPCPAKANEKVYVHKAFQLLDYFLSLLIPYHCHCYYHPHHHHPFHHHHHHYQHRYRHHHHHHQSST